MFTLVLTARHKKIIKLLFKNIEHNDIKTKSGTVHENFKEWNLGIEDDEMEGIIYLSVLLHQYRFTGNALQGFTFQGEVSLSLIYEMLVTWRHAKNLIS